MASSKMGSDERDDCEGECEKGSTGLGLDCSSKVQVPSGRNEDTLAEIPHMRQEVTGALLVLPVHALLLTIHFPCSWSVWIFGRRALSGLSRAPVQPLQGHVTLCDPGA